MNKLRVGDKVLVLVGKDKGKTGKIKSIKNGKVIIEGVNIVKRSIKPQPQFNIPGGINEFEKAIDISNVMFFEGSEKTKIKIEVDKKLGKRKRISKKTGKDIK